MLSISHNEIARRPNSIHSAFYCYIYIKYQIVRKVVSQNVFSLNAELPGKSLLSQNFAFYLLHSGGHNKSTKKSCGSIIHS